VGRAAARIEKAGIPTMTLTRKGFSQVVMNAFGGMGFPVEAPIVHEFPQEMFLKGSNLAPLNENMDKVVYGLTKWRPKVTTKGIFIPPLITIQGNDYQQAVDKMNALFMKNMWGAGLPLVPPTEGRVAWIMEGTDLGPDQVISPPGGVVPRGGIATVQSIAVALAMAGGRPEYLPILIAAVQAITDPAFGLDQLSPTTCSVFPALIVNGPIAREVRLGSGYGLLGPDPLHPAGEVIGRAIRFIQQNLGGAIAGNGTMAIYGGMRSTNAVFAEDEEGLPGGWKTLGEERGFARGDNVVTATPVSGMANINMSSQYGTKEGNERMLLTMAKNMSAPNANLQRRSGTDPNVATGVILFGRSFAASLVEASGYSKMDVKTALWNKSKIPWSQLVATGKGASHALERGAVAGEDWPITPRPEQLMIVLAGGDQSGHGYWMQVGHGNYVHVSKEIKLPRHWDELLKQAEADLGPIPVAR
jgi:hypothetical protein